MRSHRQPLFGQIENSYQQGNTDINIIACLRILPTICKQVIDSNRRQSQCRDTIVYGEQNNTRCYKHTVHYAPDQPRVNPRYLTGLDENLLNSLKADHKIVATLEDGELDGGFGEKIARFYGDSNMKVLNFGAQKEFTDRVPVEELYKRYHLTPELIAADILKAGN